MQSSTHRPIRVGVLATGNIAATVVPDMTLLPDEIQVLAVASRTPARAQEFAARFSIPRAYGSYAELIDDPDVELVYIATPHSDHLASATACLQAGKHVLCEKPLTLNAADSRELIELAAAQHRFLMEAVWTRCNPLIRKARELVAAGELGELALIQSTFGSHFEGEPSHRMINPALGGGAILDLGVYPVHLTQLMANGAPVGLLAARGTTTTTTGVDATSAALLSVGANAQAIVACSLAADLPQNLTVIGDAGTLVVPNFLNATSMTLRKRGAQHPQEFVATTLGNGYTFELAEAARCVRVGLTESPLVPHHATLEVAGILDHWLAAVPHQPLGVERS